jgi:soluble lytic murein transglycosylase
LPSPGRFHILGRVHPRSLPSSARTGRITRRITEFAVSRRCAAHLAAGLISLLATTSLAAADAVAPREQFTAAWQAAGRGDQVALEQALTDLKTYLLYPYLQYEDLRRRRATVEPARMAAFLAGHRDWAFAAGLETAWLRTLGGTGRWDALLAYASDSTDVEVRCHHTHARIRNGPQEGLIAAAQDLWTAGKSQPDACDSVFLWLQEQDGITPALAWERIRLAMEARNPRLVLYLARFLPEPDRVWAERWYQQDRGGYRRLDQSLQWPDSGQGRDIAGFGLRRLARSDPDRAWHINSQLQPHFGWSADEREETLREIALWSAVNGAADTAERMRSLPPSARDDRLLEWWARYELAQGNWAAVREIVDAMSSETAGDGRWRYWRARALHETGAAGEADAMLQELALQASYHGFLAADLLGRPYTICPETPQVTAQAVDQLAAQPGFERALELRAAGVRNWARSEWSQAARGLDRDGLRTAAALAVRENWPDRAIFALGDSGDLQWYEWRFPLAYEPQVMSNASSRDLDPAWVMGLMRSESAMAEDARSAAGALGLMQVLPGTAQALARRHAYSYGGQEQLLRADENIRFGTTYLRELLDRFGDNPVLASGAYNAGPRAVERWLSERPASEPAVWIETLPYFETRDYIPRVLAFATLYDWRMQRPTRRVSSRMPSFDSAARGGTMQADTTEIACRTPG